MSISTIMSLALATATLPPPEVVLERKEGRWHATFELPSEEQAWVFRRSGDAMSDQSPWRLQSWTVITDGVELRRVVDDDILTTKSGLVPRKVEITFSPFDQALIADYEPSLRFSDGAIAFFTGHFDLQSLRGETLGDEASSRITINAPDQIIVARGSMSRNEAVIQGRETYVLIGKNAPLTTPYMTGFVDGDLPTWAREELYTFMPTALEFYSEQMGETALSAPPTILVSWKGPTVGQSGLSGGVLEGLIAMSIEGEAMLSPDDDLTNRMRWFIAHEAAHFWLGQKLYADSDAEAWIVEGGADLAAIRMLASIEPMYDANVAIKRAWSECEASLTIGTLETARARGDIGMPYACGTVLMLAAESISGNDYFGFVRALMQAQSDNETTSIQDWLATFSAIGASEKAVDMAQSIISEPQEDPTSTLRSFAAMTGIDPALTAADAK